MITRRAARLIVERSANLPRGLRGVDRLRIYDEFTIERSWGWVFYYGRSLADLPESAPGVIQPRYPPMMVNARSGELVTTGSSWPVEKYIDDYEVQLRGRPRPG